MKKKENVKKKSFLDGIMLDFKKITLISIVLDCLFLLSAIIMYLNPSMTEKAAGVIIGIYFLIFGLFEIYEFLTRKINPIFSFRVIIGVLVIVLGIFIIVNPFRLTKILTFTLGLYLILVALFKAIDAFKLKKCQYEAWLLVLVTSIIILILGIFITINPMSSMYLIEAASLFIILSCILSIANSFMFYSRAKDIVKLIKSKKSV